MRSASSGRRAHSVVGVFPAANAATVVPHEPAPTTVTRICMASPYAPPVVAAV